MSLFVQDEFQRIPDHSLDDFKKDVIDSYSRLCEQNRKFDMPADTQLVEELMIWCHEAASLFEFSDEHYYRTLVEDYQHDEFYATSMEEHFVPFVQDVYKLAKREHLSLRIHHSKEYINFPITGVW